MALRLLNINSEMRVAFLGTNLGDTLRVISLDIRLHAPALSAIIAPTSKLTRYFLSSNGNRADRVFIL